MKNKGYTIIEIIILMVVLGLVTLGVTYKVTYSFKEDANEAYDAKIDVILDAAKEYGLDSINDLKKNDITVTVKDIVEAGFYSGDDEDGNVSDPRNNGKLLNDSKIIITYNEEDKSVSAKLG